MARLIDKDAVMSVIDKKLSYYKDLESRGLLSEEGDAAFRAVRILKSDINFLEVKEVDSNDAFIEKAVKRLEHYLDNGVWIANDVGYREKEAIIEDFRRFLEGEKC